MLSSLNSFEGGGKRPEKTYGVQRLAATTHDRDAWAIIITRLATRSFAGLDTDSTFVKSEDKIDTKTFSMNDSIREGLVKYILTDFRKRIDIAITWLNEEWYNDRIQAGDSAGPFRTYNAWALRLLDGLIPYIDNSDKLLIRFMSEIPAINRDLLERIKHLAQDPERVSLAVMVLQYLIMFRIPVRSMCLDVLEELYNTNPVAKIHASKVLQKHRPSVVSSQQSTSTLPQIKGESSEPSLLPSKSTAAA